MRATVYYRHEEENRTFIDLYRKADGDEMFVHFQPEGDETLPFPNGESMIPFADFVAWFNERTAAANMLTDEQAATIPTLYEEWREDVNYYDGTDGEHPQSRVRGVVSGLLYKCNIPHKSIVSWEPENAPVVWTVIDVAHAGTIEDPIPAARGMEYTYGLYYLDPEDGEIYLCERQGESEGGKITLQYLPHELVGQYFELVEVSDE